MDKITTAINAPSPRPDAYGALAMPVYHCAAYEFPDHEAMINSFTGVSDDPDYSRVTNPTVIHLENVVKSLAPGAKDAIAFTSGMAAISAIAMSLLATGKRIVTSRHLFGNTYLLFTRTLARFGVETILTDLTNLEAVREAIDDNTAMLYLETVSNPQMEIPDIKALADIAHAKGAAVVADTTMIPFIFTDSKAMGIDVEVLSSTKYLSGGATSLGGLVIDYGSIEDFDHTIRKELLMNLGGYMNPHAAYMQTLGLQTLLARYDVHERNVRYIAENLLDMEGVEVCWPGLEDNPYHDLAKRQFDDHYSAMLTLKLPSEKACFSFIDALKLVHRATNLFDNKTLAIHPASTIFGTIDKKTREEMDVSDRLIRLSVGLENPDDLIADLRQALEAALTTK